MYFVGTDSKAKPRDIQQHDIMCCEDSYLSSLLAKFPSTAKGTPLVDIS